MDKVVIVTGANRGLGAAIARALGAAGATVVLAVRRPGAAAAVLAELAGRGVRADEVVLDVRSFDLALGTVATTLKRHGRIDAIVNNAGVVEPIGYLADTDPRTWSDAIVANLVGPYNLVRAVLPRFLAAGGGTILNISTGASAAPREGWSAYCSSKAGLAMLSRVIDLEYAAKNIRTYSLRPGMIDTDMQGQIRASGINPVSRMPREKLGSPTRPACIAAWLALAAPADLAGKELAASEEPLYARAVAELPAARLD